MDKIMTVQKMNEANNAKADTWEYALNKYSGGKSEMDFGIKLYGVQANEPLACFVRKFPNVKYVSIEATNTTSGTSRVLYLHDIQHRVVYSTKNIEVKDEEVFVGLPKPAKSSCFQYLVKKLFSRRLKTRSEMNFYM